MKILLHIGSNATASAARNGDLANVTRLLSEGHVDVNVTDKEVGVHVIGLSYSSAGNRASSGQ